LNLGFIILGVYFIFHFYLRLLFAEWLSKIAFLYIIAQNNTKSKVFI